MTVLEAVDVLTLCRQTAPVVVAGRDGDLSPLLDIQPGYCCGETGEWITARLLPRQRNAACLITHHAASTDLPLDLDDDPDGEPRTVSRLIGLLNQMHPALRLVARVGVQNKAHLVRGFRRQAKGAGTGRVVVELVGLAHKRR